MMAFVNQRNLRIVQEAHSIPFYIRLFLVSVGSVVPFIVIAASCGQFRAQLTDPMAYLIQGSMIALIMLTARLTKRPVTTSIIVSVAVTILITYSVIDRIRSFGTSAVLSAWANWAFAYIVPLGAIWLALYVLERSLSSQHLNIGSSVK